MAIRETKYERNANNDSAPHSQNPIILQVYINQSINTNENARHYPNWMAPGTQVIFFLAVKGMIIFKL